MKNDDNKQLKEWDHKKLGKELGLFTFSDVVGKGLPLWTPKGAVIRREIERFIVDEEIKRGYQHVYTPDIAKLDLYKKSGHYPYYKDSMYAPIKIEDEDFMLRPMTCPHHFELFLDVPRSYKELPIRYAELAKLYRFEKSGELMGLQRVRSFCLSDAHIICMKEQAGEEIKGALKLIDYAADVFGLKKGIDYSFRLSLGDREDNKKYYKDDDAWNEAEEILRKALNDLGEHFVEASGEAAFYGPKIDIQMINANGKEDTAFTVQYDFVFPKRFDLTFTNHNSEKEEAVVIHRSSVGAIERLIAFLIEKYKGSFPLWLSPIQIKVLPISDKIKDYAVSVVNKLAESGIRVELDDRSEPLPAKIRDAQELKIPYMVIIGKKEEDSQKISVRKRDGNSLGEIEVEEFINQIKKEIEEKVIS